MVSPSGKADRCEYARDMDWIATLVVALVGPASAFGAAALVEKGQTKRAIRAEMSEGKLRDEGKAAERWEQAKPAALKVLDTFVAVRRLARPNYHVEQPAHQIPFGEGFPGRWADDLADVEVNSAMIPDAAYRAWLTTVTDGISDAEYLAERTSYARSYQTAVAVIASIGVSVIASWLRRDESPEASVLSSIDELKKALADMNEQFESEAQDQADFERSQRAALKGTQGE